MHVHIWQLPVVFSEASGSYLDFSVAGAGCEQPVVRGESAAQHFVVVCLDLCQLLTCGAFKHLSTEQLHGINQTFYTVTCIKPT